MTEEAANALGALARLPIRPGWDDDHVLFALDEFQITVGHVNDARAALAGRREWDLRERW